VSGRPQSSDRPTGRKPVPLTRFRACAKRNRQLPVAMLCSPEKNGTMWNSKDDPVAVPHAAMTRIIRYQTTLRKRPSRWVE
jgi:hypothetical protein